MQTHRVQRGKIRLDRRHTPELRHAGVAAVFDGERPCNRPDIAQLDDLGRARELEREAEDIAAVRIGVGTEGQARHAALF